MSKQTDRTSVREQLAIIDTADGKPRLWDAVIGEIDYTDVSLEEWLKASKLSGGRIAIRIELTAIDVTEWLTVESDTLRMVVDGHEESGPYLRSVFRQAVAQQREGMATIRPVLRAETPLAGGDGDE